jgi:phosphoribosylformylglycinamidine (FGAM) synthase-like amidotransferase family enzyme
MGEKEMLTAFLGICKGVQELSKKQLSHNDIKVRELKFKYQIISPEMF